MFRKLSVFTTVFFLVLCFHHLKASGQQGVSISGSNCAVAGSTQYYNLSTNEDQSNNSIQWCVTNGTILQVYGGNPSGGSGCMSATGGTAVVVTWNASVTGSVSVYTPSGSATLNVALANALNPGTISNTSQTIGYNQTPTTINCSVATYGACSPSYVYQWESSTDGVNWSAMSQTSQNLTVSSGLLVTTYFRRKVFEQSTYTIGYSNTATVFVNPPFSSITISPAQQNIYTGTTPTSISGPAASGGGCSSYSYQWEYSVDGGASFNNVTSGTGGNSTTYTPSALTQTTVFRRKDFCGPLNSSTYSFSNNVVVNVYQHLSGGTLSATNTTISYNTNPELFITNASGGICQTSYHNYTYTWQKSTDGINFTDIPNTNTYLNYNPGKLTASTYFRRKVVCDETAYSNVILITVNPQVFPGSISPGNISTYYNSNPGQLTTTAASGGACSNNFQYQWQSSTDGINFTNIVGATGQVYTPGNLLSTTYYRRQVTCAIDVLYTNVCKVTVTTTNVYNLIQTREITKPGVINESSAAALNTLLDVKQTTQYFDQLGRRFQTVQWQASPLQKDVVSMQSYDEYGREAIKYLPYVVSTSDGSFKNPSLNDQQIFNVNQFPGENYFYSLTQFEPSPLNRVEKSYAQGVSWVGSGRGIEQKFWGNKVDDAVRIWNIVENPGGLSTYNSSGAYNPNQLFKNVTVDERGKQTIEFKDKEGRLILKKVQLLDMVGGVSVKDEGQGKGYKGWLSTYYIYDDLGQLRAVLQPKAVEELAKPSVNWQLSQKILDELTFRYEYDGNGRMIMKKVPGAGVVYMVYDVRDRLVFTQDANLRATGKWLATLYDELNRPVMTGFVNFNGSQGNLITIVEQQTSSNSSGSSVPADLVLVAANTGDRIARNSITLDNTFLAETSFTAEIASIGSETGETTLINGVAVHQNPIPDGSNFDLLTQTHYDDYSGLVAILSSSLVPSGYSTYLNAPASDYPEPVEKSGATKGLTTWTKVKVLGSNSQFIYTAIIYDAKGRVIQAQTENQTKGIDVITNQYSFSGQLLRSHLKHQRAGGTTQTYQIATKNSYDALSRLVKTEKSLGGSSAWKVVSQLQYDALGQLKNKKLGIDPTDVNGTAALEELDYAYNIRGWLLGVNKDQTLAANGSSARRFGFELGYDKINNTTGKNYIAAQYNGNISGMIWKSVGDGIRRKYDFSYDGANRFMQGLFEQNDEGTTWGNSKVNYEVKMGDGTNAETAYDANGNIKRMQQFGLRGLTNGKLDDLQYDYRVNGVGDELTNKLYRVSDQGSNAGAKIGDFRDGTYNTTSDDYNYDGNGNLSFDNNKAIGAIQYNHLNLPQLITVKTEDGSSTKGTISYVYDAAGNKLKKITVENPSASNGNQTKTTTTTYIGGFVYEQVNSEADNLQFMAHEEGRIRPIRDVSGNITSYTYDYFIKDHLGNTRMVLTEEQKTDVYPAATLEGSLTTSGSPNAVSIEKNYYTVEEGKIAPKSEAIGIADYPNNNGVLNNNPYSQPNSNSEKLYKLRATSSGGQTGLSMTLKVMSGDKISILGKSYWFENNSSYTNYNIPALELLNGMMGSPGGVIAGKGLTGADLYNTPSINTAIQGFLSNADRNKDYTNSENSLMPKAYINWVFFDEQFNYAGGGFDRVKAANIVHSHSLPNIQAPKNGYVYIYVSNQSPVNVFFDNLQVSHTKGPITEETHYYPFGLTIAGLSSKAVNFGGVENRYKFNEGSEFASKEFSDGSGLDWYETTFRGYDPQIGRFHQLDPLAEMNPEWSAYSFVQNNPLIYVDPQGLDTFNVKNLPTDRQFNETDVLVDDDGVVMGTWDGSGWDIGKELQGVTVTGTKNQDQDSESGVMGWVHTGLDILGQVPLFGEGADLINGGLYALQGDYVNAGISIASTIPLLGNATSGLRLGKKGLKQLHHLIPKKVYKTYKKELAAIGYKRDHVKNLLELPVPFHGNHPAYSKYVQEQVDGIMTSGMTSAEKFNSMVDLQKTMSNQIQNIPSNFPTLNSYFNSLGY